MENTGNYSCLPKYSFDSSSYIFNCSDEIEAKRELFGKNPSGFDYENAPERGWQKDKRDFTYQETYRKYHMFEYDEPYAV